MFGVHWNHLDVERTRYDVMNLFSLKTFMGSSIFFNRALDQVIAPATRGELRTSGGLSCKEDTKQVLTEFKRELHGGAVSELVAMVSYFSLGSQVKSNLAP